MPRLKKKYGQHFLTENWVTAEILAQVQLDDSSSVFEIGGGAGFLTRAILTQKLARLWVFEIDVEWATYLQRELFDPRLSVYCENILDLDFVKFEPHQPWILLANLPYQVTFPILYLLQKKRHLLREGVIMVQAEVAQKIVKTGGRDYGFPSLFLQHYFDWRLLSLVPPTAFNPPPKVNSRLLYFAPKLAPLLLPNEKEFWQFIKLCFKAPRRTLRNNLLPTHYDWKRLPSSQLELRAQQLRMADLLQIWQQLLV